MKKFRASLVTVLVVVGTIIFGAIFSNVQAASRDCNANSIMYCGALGGGELSQKFNANAPGDLPAIYQAYGISAHEMTHADSVARMGTVHRNGDVTVGNEVVATEAWSIGRQKISPSSQTKSIGGKTYWNTSNQAAFRSETIPAFVFFDQHGQFKAAILTSCGNPVSAKPKPKPKPQEQPEYKCVSLTAAPISRTEYRFTANASASGGAIITGYAFDFGDGEQQNSTAATVDHTYDEPGSYIARVTVNVSANGQAYAVTAPACEVRIDIDEEASFACDSLTATRTSHTEYRFDAQASAENGATITGYTIDFGDGSEETFTDGQNIEHTYAEDGTYTAVLTVSVDVDGEEKMVTGEQCKAKVTVSPDECRPGIPIGDDRCEPCPLPGKEHLPKDSPKCKEDVPELPQTGPMDFLGGSLGVGSLVAAGYYWQSSRRGILEEFMK